MYIDLLTILPPLRTSELVAHSIMTALGQNLDLTICRVGFDFEGLKTLELWTRACQLMSNIIMAVSTHLLWR